MSALLSSLLILIHDAPILYLGLCIISDNFVAYNSHYWRRLNLKGKLIEEEYFHVALPVILEMIFLDVDKYIAVFWSGDFDYLDKRIEILYSQNKGKSEIITGLFKISKPFVKKTIKC